MTFEGYKRFLYDPATTKSPLSSLTPEQVKNDLEFLIDALNCAYPGKWSMPLAHWEEIIQTLQSLEYTQSISVEEFGETIADMLWSVPDGHLKVNLGKKNLGKIFKSKLRTPTTGDNFADIEKKKFWKFLYKSHKKGPVPVLAISGFPQAAEKFWLGFREAVEETLLYSDLIIDLRGNKGGDDTSAIEMASVLLGKPFETHWIQEVICESAEAYALQINTYNEIIWNGYESKNQIPPVELIHKRQFLVSKANELELSPLPERKLIRQELPSSMGSQDSKRAFNGKLFVLIDSNTVSSGEWTALYLKKLPNVTLVGENTYGMIHFGNSGILRLPFSGLEITLCMKINKLTDGRFYEKVGVPPDVPVVGVDSLEFVLSNLIGVP